MNRIIFLLILLIGLSSSVYSQNANLNDYSYIIVPEKFDFLQEEDQFQLNSMTKFYLDKYGFNALFNKEVPENVRRCDGLWANVLRTSGLVYTKLEVVIKDCKGNEIYRSHQGRSKFKHYKKAYQEALRKAFMGFQNLNVSQPEMNLYQETELKDKPVVNEIVSVSETSSIKGNLPEDVFSAYTHKGLYYLMRKNNTGYAFYEESKKGDLVLIGNFYLKNNALIYQEINGNSYDAVIDSLGTLNIYLDGKPAVFQQLNQ